MGKPLADLIKSHDIAARDVNFAEPWEARAFAIAIALSESGRIEWDEFRERLIAEIGAADRANTEAAHYYECWLRALERVLAAKQIASVAEIEHSAESIAANPPMPTKAVSAGPIKIA
jgi:nitrile hydratase accessory protein